MLQVNPAFPTPALLTAPTNGNIVAGLPSNTGGTANTIVDSNSVSYTQEITSTTAALAIGIFDHVVAGSPTATYSNATNPSATAMYELTNALLPARNYVQNSSATSGSTLVTPAFTPGVGDLVICEVAAINTVASITSSNVVFTLDNPPGPPGWVHGSAVAAVSTTVVATIASGAQAALVCGDYK